MIVGTDTNMPFVIPGYAAYNELENFIACGIDVYSTLQAATRNAADCLGKLDEFGTVTKGKRADLLLLDKNPLADIKDQKSLNCVSLRGMIMTKTDLQHILDSHAGKIRS